MKQLFIVFSFLLSTQSFATDSIISESRAVKLTMSLILNGKLISQSSLVTTMGETAIIFESMENGDETWIEALPTLASTDSKNIYIKFNVGQKQNGQVQWNYTPQVIVKDKKEASISVGNANSNKTFEMTLKVTPELL